MPGWEARAKMPKMDRRHVVQKRCPRPHDRINGLVALRELTFMLETVGSTQHAKGRGAMMDRGVSTSL